MRNSCRVLGDAAVVRQRLYDFSVPKARRAQNEPLGLEDGDTSLAKLLRRYFQQGHDTGSILKRRRGRHLSPPFRAWMGPAGSDRPADPLWCCRITQPLLPSPEERIRRCGLWLWLRTERDLQ